MRWLAGGALVAAALGCGGAPRAQDCMSAVRGYHDALRWQRLPAAAAFIAPLEREAFLDQQEELVAELRIDDYEVTRMQPVGPDRARVQVRYTWHLDNVGRVHDTTTEQLWERRGKQWLMAEERRTRGETMPGVAEPAGGPSGSDAAGDPPGRLRDGRQMQ